MLKTTLSPELLERHSARGPRYTSYPTALQFHESIGSATYQQCLKELGATEEPLSIYVHLPFCRKLCLYCACNVVVTQSPSAAEQYLEDLRHELELVSRSLQTRVTVKQLHLGGGTPTFFSPSQLRRLHDLLEQHFDFQDRAEKAIEIDPRVTSYEHLQTLKEIGFQRVSFGVQDFDPLVQKLIQRNQSAEQSRRLFHQARELGFESINIDLMYGLPGQSLSSFDQTLTGVLQLEPDRIACFGYAHVPWLKKAQSALDKYERPNTHERFQLFARAIERLTEGDYQFIGLDHFAKKSDELARTQRQGTLKRNFQGYTTDSAKSILALGVSGISEVGVGDGYYFQNTKDLKQYRAALRRGEFPVERGLKLTRDDSLRRELIMNLMCGDLRWASLQAQFPEITAESFAEEREKLARYEDLGFLCWNEEGIEITDIGRFFVRNICMAFDSYLGQPNQRYSKTI